MYVVTINRFVYAASAIDVFSRLTVGWQAATSMPTGARPPASRTQGSSGARVLPLAEDRGFEPLRALTQPAFQASAIGH